MKEPVTGRDLLVISALCTALGVLVAWGLFYRWGTAPPLKPMDLPAWVQAVGSVGAILAAIGIAAHERSVAKSLFERQERLASNGRFTRGHRTIRRFKKIIAKHLAKEVAMPPGAVIHPIERETIPEAVLDLEHDCHLMGDAGADCLNAIRNFEEAQDMIDHSMLRWVNGEDFFEKLRLADQHCDQAISHFVKYLTNAKN